LNPAKAFYFFFFFFFFVFFMMQPSNEIFRSRILNTSLGEMKKDLDSTTEMLKEEVRAAKRCKLTEEPSTMLAPEEDEAVEEVEEEAESVSLGALPKPEDLFRAPYKGYSWEAKDGLMKEMIKQKEQEWMEVARVYMKLCIDYLPVRQQELQQQEQQR
jgi:hypothetical protein